MKIYLSPSTQDHNIGLGNYGTEEYRMNQIADLLQVKLAATGKYEIYRNRPEMTVREIIDESNSIMPDIHIAIHSNAGGGIGPEIFINEPDANKERLAMDIYNEILNIYYEPSLGRGLKYDNNLLELRETNSISTLLEVAFHDNEIDKDWILNNLDNIAEAIFLGIEKYFGN